MSISPQAHNEHTVSKTNLSLLVINKYINNSRPTYASNLSYTAAEQFRFHGTLVVHSTAGTFYQLGRLHPRKQKPDIYYS